MKPCFVVLGEPGRQFLGVHVTIDGAVHAAAGHGAFAMPSGAAAHVDSVAAWLQLQSFISLRCADGEDPCGMTIERHAIML